MPLGASVVALRCLSAALGGPLGPGCAPPGVPRKGQRAEVICWFAGSLGSLGAQS